MTDSHGIIYACFVCACCNAHFLSTWSTLVAIDTSYWRLLSSADDLFKQIGSRSGPTFCRS